MDVDRFANFALRSHINVTAGAHLLLMCGFITGDKAIVKLGALVTKRRPIDEWSGVSAQKDKKSAI